MAGIIGYIVTFFSNIVNGIVSKWMEMRESRKRGEAEAINEIYEESAAKKTLADRILAQPIKKGIDLINSIRLRGRRR
jgi:hypothetical protein